ncbi:cold shock domain-containing protein E1 isoform X2 [Macrosteles quadrilineatus]|uniref:cold shock domain-containing protein E1 isoform X2 n=1 Tax=Macrosteles quadrilineatus TaxID=74068 RepID=UPI0023E27252|nr:cold shock domain-containing protein E1 isoform X2 [Macrosteles quadrilineatus]
MSNNPQWKSFQPPAMNSDSSILDLAKSLTLQNNAPPSSNYRNPANGSGFNSSNNFHPVSNIKNNLSNNVFSNTSSNFSNYNAYPTNNSRFPQIGTFSSDSTDMYGGDNPPVSNSYNSSSNNSNSTYNDSSLNNQGTRETGIIEKLLHSYGFIQCCERQARLFFHFSQFSGNIEHLKIGDPVEFEMTYDRRTGKPIASTVTKIAPEVVLSEERVTGTVTTELRSDGSVGDTQGRISYENRGECFFLPYNKDDVEGNVTLRSGDKVSFQIATNQRGNLGASHVRLENPAHPVKYQGVVCSMKESFGFIERADVVKEIFFHFSENKSKDDLQLGDDVEFIIQTRNGKEVACNITTLPGGSVVFEDVADDIVKGQVLKPVERGLQARQHQNDPLPGRIRYRAPDHSEVEIPFGDKDQKRDFTLRHGDWVQFRIATDRRDQLQRATTISLLPESFVVSGEKREQGVVVALKEGFGFLRCVEREPRLYFHFNEVLDIDREIALNDEVEFTVVQEPNSSSTYGSNSRQSAVRIKHLPPGTVKFETLVEEGLSGVVTKEPPSSWGSRSPTKNNSLSPGSNEKPPEPGTITYQSNGTKKTIPFYYKDCDPRNTPHQNDKVEFSISQVKRNKELIATNIVTKPQAQSVPMKNGISNSSPICQGFVAALKDGFGFIETIAHDREVFFHFSNFEGDSATLEVGQEVEYTLGSRGSSGSCKSAENVRVLPPGTIRADVTVADEVLEGFVVRPLRSVNPDQQHYSGLISLDPEGEENGSGYDFGITSLTNKRELLQVGDPVQFQVDSDGRAANVTAIRAKKKATVESIKDSYGFLNYEVEEGKKLFFHMSEVKDREKLSPGDTVEFVLVTNNRSKRSYATSVAKLSGEAAVGQRPERLISRLRTISVDDGPKLTVMRQPRGPDATKGFSASHRVPRSPGIVLE